MKVILQRSEDAPWQRLKREWYGAPIVPNFEFRFRLTADALVFTARHASSARLHPKAREGMFQEELWKYDTAEFFIAPLEANRYMEFNLAPNGAWWSAAFTAPRVADPTMPTEPPGVIATGHLDDEEGWQSEASLPLAYLKQMGIIPGETPFRLAVSAILYSPAQLFLTTATDLRGKPNFHRPLGWEEAELAPEA